MEKNIPMHVQKSLTQTAALIKAITGYVYIKNAKKQIYLL